MQARRCASTKTSITNCSSRRCPGLIDSASFAFVTRRFQRARRARRSSLTSRMRRARRFRRSVLSADSEQSPPDMAFSIAVTGIEPMTSSQNQPLRYVTAMMRGSETSCICERLSAFGSRIAVRKLSRMSNQKQQSTNQITNSLPVSMLAPHTAAWNASANGTISTVYTRRSTTHMSHASLGVEYGWKTKRCDPMKQLAI
mmetsp:Transcript_50675/g.103112  ORF Transcript_50675/g.103112 Transcript_50675/m.103112 type:complete len:200 (+) Transcript_50675:103-702(+)